MFFEIGIFGKFLEFFKLQIFEFYKLDIFHSTNCKFFEFSKFEVFGIVQVRKLENFKIFFYLVNQSLAPKIGNFGIVHPFDIPHYTQFCQFSYFPLISINFDALTSQLLFHILVKIS